MLTALLGRLTATLFGSSDFLGWLASRHGPAVWIPTVVYAVSWANLTMLSAVRIRPLGMASMIGALVSGRDDSAGANRATGKTA